MPDLNASRPPRMFPTIPLIGELSQPELEKTLKDLGVQPAPAEPGAPKRAVWWKSTGAWKNPTHQFGYISPSGRPGSKEIKSVGDIEVDTALVDQRIDIHLNRLRVFEYPGSGQHRILFTFKAQNQLEKMSEPVSFSQLFRARDDATLAVRGYPIFIGLSVGKVGAAFQGFTVNVKNDNDEALLSFLDSDAFKSGLGLLKTAQPALQPLMKLTLGVTQALAGHNKNVAVQDFYLGLDFSGTSMGARLAVGDYIAAQVPKETSINWAEWHYDSHVGTIVRKTDSTEGLPYNYVVFGVSKHPE
jgi:hypothetical protein